LNHAKSTKHFAQRGTSGLGDDDLPLLISALNGQAAPEASNRHKRKRACQHKECGDQSCCRMDLGMIELEACLKTEGMPLKTTETKAYTRHKGVRKVGGRYKARITVPGKGIRHIGSYDSEEDAVQAYQKAHVLVHGVLPGSVVHHKCAECGMMLASKTALTNHIRAHNNDRAKKERIAASSDQVQDLRVDLSKWRNKSRAGYKGVRQVGCRFEARTSAGGKGTRSLGYYNSAEEAARAYALDHLSHAQANQKYSEIGKKTIDLEAEQCDTGSGATPSLPSSSLTEESHSPPPSTSSNSSSVPLALGGTQQTTMLCPSQPSFAIPVPSESCDNGLDIAAMQVYFMH